MPAWAPARASEAPAAQVTLAQALDAAWARSLASAQAAGWQRRAHAEKTIAGSWLASAPSLAMSQRDGSGTASGSETELGLSLPLWRPGLRQLTGRAAQAESAWAQAAERVARWQLAAQLRDQASRWLVAHADVRQAVQQHALLAALSADVERRVKAGDLAPADALAAKAEVLAALAQERQAHQALQAQRSGWAVLTGLHEAPAAETAQAAPPVAQALAQHPEALLAQALVQRAQERLAVVQSQGHAPPELGVGVRQERLGDGRLGEGQASKHSVMLSLRLPFGADTYKQPQVADAMAELDIARLAQQRMRQQLEAELALAHSALDSSAAQTAAELARSELLRQRAKLLNQSFLAGESSLPELLRALDAAAQAEAAAARQQAALAQARARLQHAFGLLP